MGFTILVTAKTDCVNIVTSRSDVSAVLLIRFSRLNELASPLAAHKACIENSYPPITANYDSISV